MKSSQRQLQDVQLYLVARCATPPDRQRVGIVLTSEADTLLKVSCLLRLLVLSILQPHVPANEKPNGNERETQSDISLHDEGYYPACEASVHFEDCEWILRVRAGAKCKRECA